MPRRIRVVTARDPIGVPSPILAPPPQVIVTDQNPRVPPLTANEKRARRFYATSSSMGSRQASVTQSMAEIMRRTAGDTIDSGQAQFYSPQLSTDFLEKPQNLRERRAFYRFFYNTNEIVGQAIDIHSTLPLSKLRLVPPKGKNKHQNEYIFKFFENMCNDMRLFKNLIEITHEYFLMGNCCHKSAEIRTLDGYKQAQNVSIGDMLLTNKGRFKKAIRRSVRPAENILHIKCWKDFREIPVTEEHPIEIFRDGELIPFVNAEEVQLSDYVRITWPTENEDRERVDFVYDDRYAKTDGGLVQTVHIPHKRNHWALKARKGLIDWIGSLAEPTIKSRRDLADDFGVPISTLNNVIASVSRELGKSFHERIGADGWQKGSQVKWLPTDMSSISITDEYDIVTTRFLHAVDGVDINEDFMYLVGFWLGNGTLARDSSRDDWGRGLWQISFKETCTNNINRVRTILHNIFGSDAITEWTSEGMTYLKVLSNPAFVEWWADNFGETTFGKNNKKIPHWCVLLPCFKQSHLLAGLIDSDGCISGGSGFNGHTIVNVSTASRHIMDPLRDITLRCGILTNYSCGSARECCLPNNRSVWSSEMYTLTASDEESCRMFVQHAIKKIPEDAHFSEAQRYCFVSDQGIGFKVKSIETEKYDDLVYNFEVEDDHTFQVAGFSTHNCFIFAEQHDWKDGLTEQDLSKKGQEAKQRSEYLEKKFGIVDKNPLFKGWKKLVVLPPDQVRVRKLPLTDDVAIEYMPDPETRKYLTSDVPVVDSADPDHPTTQYSIPEEIKEKVRRSGIVPMDTDPNTGSHVYLLARKKSQYEPLGISIIERCVNTLVLLDKLRQAQTSIASRHMTPMRIVWAEDLNDDGVDNLREQVDMALVDPDFSIIANYEIHWEEMGSQGRLLDIEAENEAGMNRLFAGLGVTREVLTGEGTYTGSKISLEIMNQMYLLYREQLQDYIENYLFKPIAKKKGFIEYDDYGNEIILYPKLSFTRLAIRDNEQFFDAAYQLYQKGSLSVDLILDVLNIDPDSTRHKLEQDLFTVNDSIFNEVLRNLYTNVAGPMVEQTDLVQKLAAYLKLNVIEQPKQAAAGTSRFSSKVSSVPANVQPPLPVAPVDPEQSMKLAKIMKHFALHPEIVDQVFNRMS